MKIIFKKASSDFCVGIFYGILSILSIGPSQFLAFRYFVFKGITESQIFMSGSFIGQLFIYLSVYNNSLYRALMKPHLMSLLAIPYLILRLCAPVSIEKWKNRILLQKMNKKWKNRILLQKILLKNPKLYIFIDGFCMQLLNPFLFANSTLTRLFSLLILRYNFSSPVFAGIILGWSVSYILCIKTINWIFSYINKDPYIRHQIQSWCEVFVFVSVFGYFGSARIPLSIYPWRPKFYQVEDDDEQQTQELTSERQEKNIVSKNEKQNKNEIVVSQIMASNNTESKGLKKEQTNLNQRKNKILKELQEFEQQELEQETRKILKELQEFEPQELKQETRTQNCKEIEKENTYSNWQQFSPLEWPNFFFNFKRWTRNAYIRPYEDFQSFLKARVSQYFFGKCLSDGKERLCFTKFPALFFLEQKIDEIHSTDYEDFWINNLRNKKFYFWQELRDRLDQISNADFIVRKEDKQKYRVDLAPIENYEWLIRFEETLQKYCMQQAYKYFREKTIPWLLKKKREIAIKKQVFAIRKDALEKRVQLTLPGGDNFQIFDDPLLCGSSRVLVKYYKWVEFLSQVRLRTFTEEYVDEQKKRIEEKAIENLWKMVEKKVEEKERQEKEQQEAEQQSVEIKRGRGSVAIEVPPKEEEQLTTEEKRLLATEKVQEKLDFYDAVKTLFSFRFEKEKNELIKQFFSEEQQEQGLTNKKNSEYLDLLDFHDYLKMKDKQDPLLDYIKIPKGMIFRSSYYLKKSSKIKEYGQIVSSKFRNKKYSLPWKLFLIEKTRSTLSTNETSSKEKNTHHLIFQEQKLTNLDIGIISEKIYLNDVYISKNFGLKILYKQTDQKKKTLRNPFFFEFFSLLLFDEKSRGILLEFFEKIEWDLIERLIEVKKKKRMEFKCIKQRTNNNFFRLSLDITKELPEEEHDLIEDYEYEDQTIRSDFRTVLRKNVGYYGEGNQESILKSKNVSCNNRLYMFKGTIRPRKGKCVRPFRVQLRCLKSQTHSPLVLRMKKLFQKRKLNFQKVCTSINKFKIRLLWKFVLRKLMKIYKEFELFHSPGEEQNKKSLNAHKISLYKRKYYANLTKLDHHLYHKIRGPLLIFQALFRKIVVLPFLIGIKNVGRILLLQTPEFLEDWTELSAEVYINCTFDGVEFSEQKRPGRWWEDGFQIKILNPFRLKPWREAFGTSQKVKPTYMSIGGYEVDAPYGNKVQKLSFWKPVLTEIKKLSEIPVDSALVSFLSKVNQVVYKLRWVCTQINCNWVNIEIDISKIKKIKAVIQNRLSSFGYTTDRKRSLIRKINLTKKKEEQKQSYSKDRFVSVSKTKEKTKMLKQEIISKYKELHLIQNEIKKLKSEIYDEDVFQKEKSPKFDKKEFRVSNRIHSYRESNEGSDGSKKRVFSYPILGCNLATLFSTIILYQKHYIKKSTRHFVIKIKRIFLLNRKKIKKKQESFSLNKGNILSQAYVFHDIWRCITNNKPFFKPFLQSKETYPFIKQNIRTFLGKKKLFEYKEPHALRIKDWKHWLKCYDRYDLSSKHVWFYINPKRVRNKIGKQRKHNKNIFRLFLEDKLQNKCLPVFTSFKNKFLFKLNKCYRFNILAYNYLDFQKTGNSQLFLEREKTKRIGVYPDTSSDFLLNYILRLGSKKKKEWPVKMNDQLMTELDGIFKLNFFLKNRKEQKEDEKVETGHQKMALRRFIIKPCIFSVQKGKKLRRLPKSERKLSRKMFKKSFEIISTQDNINSELKKQKDNAFDLKKQREAAAQKKKLIQKKRLLTKAERDGMNVTEKKKSIETELETLLEQEIKLKKEEESQAELLKAKKEPPFYQKGLQGLIKENDEQQLFDKVIDQNFIGQKLKSKRGFVFFFWGKNKKKEENTKKLQVTKLPNKQPNITSKKKITSEYKLFSQEDLDQILKDPEYKKREEHLQKLLDFVDEQKDDDLIDEEIDNDMYILFPRKFYREILLWKTLKISYADLNRQLVILRKVVNDPVKKKALTNIFFQDIHLEPLYFMCEMRSLGFRQKDFRNVLLKRTAYPIAQLPTERVLTKRLINLSIELFQENLDKQKSKSFDLKLDHFILEDVFIPRHRKEFRVLNRLFFFEVGFQKEQQLNEYYRYFFLNKNNFCEGEKRKRNLVDSEQKVKRFLWPNYRLEDLLCMNRYWYNITDGSCNSIVRLRMYPLF
uniref:Translocon at the inner envelope membrane of chloroplasts 214 n=1 Tax=Gnetum gnemon TaxID=3382 RepID=A0A0B5ENW3_GNEGN|nr:hypothetical protein [Gnetum gnemon]AJE71516.1 hypothetical protein [Gnetum gnemon]ALK01073.1 hypothetical protein [Gnetum gnemon]